MPARRPDRTNAATDTPRALSQYHPGATVTQVVGSTNFPPSFAAVGYAPCFKGFGCATPPLLDRPDLRVPIDEPRRRAPSPALTSPRPPPPRARSRSPPPGQRPDAGSDGNLDAVSFVQRASVVSDPPRGAFQHVAVFKNILVAADGDDSARLHVFDIRDWSEKQVIRVGEVSEEVTGRPTGGEGPAPATVSALAFDGATIAVGTHQGHAHTWRLAEHEGKRGYVRLLQPLKVDAGPITKLHVSGDAQLLTAYSASKRTLVAWELDTGKLRGAFCVDGVARGSPLRLTANCGSVIACVHALVPGQKPQTGAPVEPIAALLDVRTGEGGMVRDVSALAGEGDPICVAFDGELLVVGTTTGAVVAWNVAEGYAAWKGHHKGAVGALASVPGDPARVLSGGADRAVILWDARGNALARLELGAAVTALAAPTERTAVAGTETGFVELLALGAPDAPRDEEVTKMVKRGRVGGSAFVEYAPKHDHAGAPATSLDAFARIVPVREGAVSENGGKKEDDGKARAKTKEGRATAAERAMAKGMLAGAGETAAEAKARAAREEAEERAKHRAMDDSGVARNPDVKTTAEGARRCSNPSCVEREDTLAAGRMLRCSRCKSAVYCSTHCQRTHWRDGHRGECKPPADAEKGTAKEKEKEKEKEPAKETAKDEPAAEVKEASAVPVRRALVVEEDSEDEEEETPAPAPPPPRRSLVVEEDSEDEDDDDAAANPPTEALRRTTLVVEEDSDSDSDDGAVANDAPALPPWMTTHRPPGREIEATATAAAAATAAVPEARKMAAEKKSEEAAVDRSLAALEPLNADDLLYELD